MVSREKKRKGCPSKEAKRRMARKTAVVAAVAAAVLGEALPSLAFVPASSNLQLRSARVQHGSAMRMIDGEVRCSRRWAIRAVPAAAILSTAVPPRVFAASKEVVEEKEEDPAPAPPSPAPADTFLQRVVGHTVLA